MHLGETFRDAARREVLEETGVRIEIEGVAGIVERIVRTRQGGIDHHYAIIDLWATTRDRSSLQAGDDAADARWVSFGEVASMDLTPGLLGFLEENSALQA